MPERKVWVIDLDLGLVWGWAAALGVEGVLASVQFLTTGTCTAAVMFLGVTSISGLSWSVSRVKR